jgi:hypothetical protein
MCSGGKEVLNRRNNPQMIFIYFTHILLRIVTHFLQQSLIRNSDLGWWMAQVVRLPAYTQSSNPSAAKKKGQK